MRDKSQYLVDTINYDEDDGETDFYELRKFGIRNRRLANVRNRENLNEARYNKAKSLGWKDSRINGGDFSHLAGIKHNMIKMLKKMCKQERLRPARNFLEAYVSLVASFDDAYFKLTEKHKVRSPDKLTGVKVSDLLNTVFGRSVSFTELAELLVYVKHLANEMHRSVWSALLHLVGSLENLQRFSEALTLARMALKNSSRHVRLDDGAVCIGWAKERLSSFGRTASAELRPITNELKAKLRLKMGLSMSDVNEALSNYLISGSGDIVLIRKYSTRKMPKGMTPSEHIRLVLLELLPDGMMLVEKGDHRDILRCGDVERNPGPFSPLMCHRDRRWAQIMDKAVAYGQLTHHQALGMSCIRYLQCYSDLKEQDDTDHRDILLAGDIERNPGPWVGEIEGTQCPAGDGCVALPWIDMVTTPEVYVEVPTCESVPIPQVPDIDWAIYRDGFVPNASKFLKKAFSVACTHRVKIGLGAAGVIALRVAVRYFFKSTLIHVAPRDGYSYVVDSEGEVDPKPAPRLYFSWARALVGCYRWVMSFIKDAPPGRVMVRVTLCDSGRDNRDEAWSQKEGRYAPVDKRTAGRRNRQATAPERLVKAVVKKSRVDPFTDFSVVIDEQTFTISATALDMLLCSMRNNLDHRANFDRACMELAKVREINTGAEDYSIRHRRTLVVVDHLLRCAAYEHAASCFFH